MGITMINISLSENSEEINFTKLFSTVEALASRETLPPVDVICSSAGWGRCYIPNMVNGVKHGCIFTGSLPDYCD